MDGSPVRGHNKTSLTALIRVRDTQAFQAEFVRLIRGDLPHTERIADTTVTLPLFPAMTDADVDRVCTACAEVLAAHRR